MLNLVETWSFFVINVEIHLGWLNAKFSLKSKKFYNLVIRSREKHPNFRKTPTTHVLRLEGWLEMYPGGELCFSENSRYFSSWASVGPTSTKILFFYYFSKAQYQKVTPKPEVKDFVNLVDDTFKGVIDQKQKSWPLVFKRVFRTEAVSVCCWKFAYLLASYWTNFHCDLSLWNLPEAEVSEISCSCLCSSGPHCKTVRSLFGFFPF